MLRTTFNPLRGYTLKPVKIDYTKLFAGEGRFGQTSWGSLHIQKPTEPAEFETREDICKRLENEPRSFY